jgi:hypothetical protein
MNMPPEYLVAIVSSGTTIISSGIISWLISVMNKKIDRIEMRVDEKIDAKIESFPFHYRQKKDCEEVHRQIERKFERFEDACRENHAANNHSALTAR